MDMKLRHKKWRDNAFCNIRANGPMTAGNLIKTTISDNTGKKLKVVPSIHSVNNILSRDKRFKKTLTEREKLHSVVMWELNEKNSIVSFAKRKRSEEVS